jgi:hypothetical protein
MNITKISAFIFLLLSISKVCTAQHANDTLLFVIELNDDTTGLRACRWGEPIEHSLSGPVLMRDHTLLFYSRDGYLLYNENGKLLDEHSLVRKNRRLKRREKPLYRLAYPIDKSTILYYRKGDEGEESKELFQKKLFSRFMPKVKGGAYHGYETVGSSQLLNLYHNSVTDEMAIKANLKPHLVGYSSLIGGKRWWSLDKFYSFTSPIILEEEGKYLSFFPGFKPPPGSGIKKNLIEPIGVFFMNGRWYYYGAYSPGGTKREKYFQRLYLVDQAGNLLYVNSILKQTVVDDVLGENEEEKMLYTVKRAGRHVFLPAVDRHGDIYYCIMDYKKRRMEVLKRLFYKFVPVESGPALEDILAEEKGYIYDVSATQCAEAGRSRAFTPAIQFLDEAGGMRKLKKSELIKKGFIAQIIRRKDEELDKTVSRIHGSLPKRVRQIQDSLSRLSTSACPYSLVLAHNKKGELRTIDYGLGDIIISARVLNVTNTFEVFVRVDLVDWAEVIVFSTEGEYLSRFRFNTENHEVRNDVVAISADRKIVEKDYEIGEGAYRYYNWKLTTHAPGN